MDEAAFRRACPFFARRPRFGDNPRMANSFTGTLLVLASFVLTFLVARTLGKRYRARKAQRELERLRAGESRQVRRARKRREGARD